MSLHALANHMAAQGRNGDSVLVHMTPKEVGGLHALAIANGGQLTINPETGLPEASFLGDLLPAVLGFGLDMFLPGLGEAVGGAFGLSAAAGTGIAVGGLTGLATGNLSKGVMAGFGAYGGAGLAEGLMGAGANAATNAGTAGWENTLAERGLTPGTPEYGAAASDLALGAQKTALAASPMDKLTAGFSATTQSPSTLLDFGKNNWKYGLAAAAPALAGLSEEDNSTVTKMPSTGMITPFVMNRKALPRDESLSPSAQQKYFSYGVTPITPFKAAEGGAVKNFADGGEVDNTDPYTQQFLDKARTYQNTMTGDSARAFDYLMGNTRPTAQTTGTTGRSNSRGTVRAPVGMQKPAVPASTGGIQALADVVRGTGGGGGSGDAGGITPTAAAGDVNSYTNGALPAVLGLQAVPAPIVDASNYASAAQAESAQNQALAAQYGMYGNPSVGLGGEAGSSTGPNTGAVNGRESGGWGSRDAGGGTAAGPSGSNVGATSQGSAPGASASSAAGPASVGRDGSVSGGSGNGSGGVGRGEGGADSGGSHGAGGPGDARGGYLAHGNFNQRPRYADGGLGSLGGYSDGGRLLRGPGDGVSDSIPATIGQHQPARLADGEFVVPARIVSELGNGSTEAGARQLYAMMDRIQKGRKKTVGKNKVAANTHAAKHLPA